MEGLGAKLKALRKAKKLRQEDMAKALSIHRTAYTKYELDASEPPLSSLLKICRLLDVTVAELLEEFK